MSSCFPETLELAERITFYSQPGLHLSPASIMAVTSVVPNEWLPLHPKTLHWLPPPFSLPNPSVFFMVNILLAHPQRSEGFPKWLSRWLLPAMQETQIRSLGRENSPGEGNGNPLQYSRLGNPMDRGAWWTIAHGVAKSRTQLSEWTTTNNLFGLPEWLR